MGPCESCPVSPSLSHPMTLIPALSRVPLHSPTQQSRGGGAGCSEDLVPRELGLLSRLMEMGAGSSDKVTLGMRGGLKRSMPFPALLCDLAAAAPVSVAEPS